jgi:hypothetical protein
MFSFVHTSAQCLNYEMPECSDVIYAVLVLIALYFILLSAASLP